jgi:hypothetical protein
MNDLVTFKLTKEAFLIIFNEGIPFDALKQILIKKFEESAKFFDGVKYKTILKGRNFTEEELAELKEIIKAIDAIVENCRSYSSCRSCEYWDKKKCECKIQMGANVENPPYQW